MSLFDFLSFVLRNTPLPAKLILLALLAVWVAGGAAGVRYLRRYRLSEPAFLALVRTRLRNRRPGESPEDAPSTDLPDAPSTEHAPADHVGEGAPEAVAPVVLADLRIGIPPDSLVHHRLDALERMKAARVRVDSHALQQLTALREASMRGLALPGFAADLSMMLGLLGTFVGLTIMLLQMETVAPGGVPLDADAFANASARLAGLIEGQKTAYVTTLVGILSAITLSGLGFLLTRAQSSFHAELECFTAEELLPAAAPAPEDETALEKLAVELGDAFQRLGTLTRDHTEYLARMETVEASFSTTVGHIRDITRRTAGAPVEEAAGAITEMLQQLTEANGQLVQIASSVNGTQKDFVARHDDALQRLTRLLESQRRALEQLAHGRYSRGGRGIAGFLEPLWNWVGDLPVRPALALVGAGVAACVLLFVLF